LYCQVTSLCAERRPSAVYVTLPAFAAELPAAGTRHQRTQLSLDIYCTQGDQQQTSRRCCCRSTRQTDGRTDTRPLHIPRSAYYADSVNNARPHGNGSFKIKCSMRKKKVFYQPSRHVFCHFGHRILPNFRRETKCSLKTENHDN